MKPISKFSFQAQNELNLTIRLWNSHYQSGVQWYKFATIGYLQLSEYHNQSNFYFLLFFFNNKALAQSTIYVSIEIIPYE